MKAIYFLAIKGCKPQEVSKKEWIEAERNAGFIPNLSYDDPNMTKSKIKKYLLNFLLLLAGILCIPFATVYCMRLIYLLRKDGIL